MYLLRCPFDVSLMAPYFVLCDVQEQSQTDWHALFRLTDSVTLATDKVMTLQKYYCKISFFSRSFVASLCYLCFIVVDRDGRMHDVVYF